MRNFRTSKNFDKILKKLSKKDKQSYKNLLTKMNEILSSESLEHYKNLKYNLKDFKRVHVGSFVLAFKYNKNEDLVYFSDFNHHDNIYKKKD